MDSLLNIKADLGYANDRAEFLLDLEGGSSSINISNNKASIVTGNSIIMIGYDGVEIRELEQQRDFPIFKININEIEGDYSFTISYMRSSDNHDYNIEIPLENEYRNEVVNSIHKIITEGSKENGHDMGLVNAELKSIIERIKSIYTDRYYNYVEEGEPALFEIDLEEVQ